MLEARVYRQWLINLNKLFIEWGGSIDDLEESTGIGSNNLYCIFSGTRKTTLQGLLTIAKNMNAKPHQLVNIPRNGSQAICKIRFRSHQSRVQTSPQN